MTRTLNMSNPMNISELKDKIIGSHLIGRIPVCRCEHLKNVEIGAGNFKTFTVIMGVYGLIITCNRDCIPGTIVPYIRSECISCINCFAQISLKTNTIRFVKDPDQNEYICCSDKCEKEYMPIKLIKCVHVDPSTFISEDMTQKTQIYRNEQTLTIKRTCKNCPDTIYPLTVEQHFSCLECLKDIEQKNAIVCKNPKTNTSYVICSETCYQTLMKKQTNHLCTKCGFAGYKKCGKCKSVYCSTKCQSDDWKDHKKICTDQGLSKV